MKRREFMVGAAALAGAAIAPVAAGLEDSKPVYLFEMEEVFSGTVYLGDLITIGTTVICVTGVHKDGSISAIDADENNYLFK